MHRQEFPVAQKCDTVFLVKWYYSSLLVFSFRVPSLGLSSP